MDARKRFKRWFEATGMSQMEAGDAIGCSGAYVGMLVSGARPRPGLDVAFLIERATAEWDEGPILASDWTAHASEDAA